MGSCLSGSALESEPLSDIGNGGNGKRRRLTTSSSFDHRLEMKLHRVPGRIFLNGSTQVASLYCKQGRKGVNQDAMLLWENFCSKGDTVFCGVFDGHGPNGHMVSKKVRDSFPLRLIAQWDLLSNNIDRLNDLRSSISYEPEENESTLVDAKPIATGHEFDFRTMRKSFLRACKVMDKELKLHDIDCYCSGTTAVTLLKKGKDLVIGNVGDSRAVLGSRDYNGSLIPIQLTIDLKPNLPREVERIKLCKGRVFALDNEPHIARVWLPNIDCPGLAMTRTFGDFCLKDFGVISVPDVTHHHLTQKDEFVVLATDGVWDVLSNKEVVDIVASTPQSSAARTLVESAVQAWKKKLPTCKVDDCSVVCLFFNSDFKSSCNIDNSASLERVITTTWS
ncbi:hypothetical protein Lal_00011713 [Lupinus albus]|uniref:Uncharacterized protein n=1 Tax=Lupinus albus TaxID=3870 RepID=A0A6A4QDT4_LUPAL|nr:putative protein-serine/threonine phosphatase [Lupinus albus]KAF1880654.1 hypothetical protein Lal_00011713 [Lupinus albus]